MAAKTCTTGILAIVCIVACASVCASTPEEDEARIEVLIKLEHAPPASATPSATTGTAVAANVPSALNTVRSAAASAVPVIDHVPEPAADIPDAPPTEYGQALSFEDLKQQLGTRVYIVTTGGNTHLATVQAVDAKQVTLTVHNTGGAATYSLRRDQIASVEAR